MTQQQDWNLDPLYTGVTVAVFTILFILSYLIFYYCFHHFRPNRRAGLGQQEQWPDETTRFGLDPAVLKTFPVFAYSEGPDKDPSECAVCLSPFETGEKLRLLPICVHVFHIDCVDHWLVGHSTCPLCRANLDQQHVDSTLANTARLDDLESGLGMGLGNDDVEGRREIRTEGHFGNFRRWNSIGHMAVVEGLPLDVRNECLTVKMNRSKSCEAMLCSNL